MHWMWPNIYSESGFKQALTPNAQWWKAFQVLCVWRGLCEKNEVKTTFSYSHRRDTLSVRKMWRKICNETDSVPTHIPSACRQDIPVWNMWRTLQCQKEILIDISLLSTLSINPMCARFCGKSFPYKSVLKIHFRTHTGKQPNEWETMVDHMSLM